MPQLVDSLAIDIQDIHGPDDAPGWAKRLDEQAQEAMGYMIAQLDAASLWWITEPMSLLAQAASRDMPEWDWAGVRPSPSGVILWDGSTGIQLHYADGEPGPTAHGIFWWSDSGATVLSPLIRAADNTQPTRSTGLSLWWLSWSVDDIGPAITRMSRLPDAQLLHALLGATLTLAQQPTIVTRREHPHGERMLTPRPHTPVLITQVTLRESLRDAAEAQTTPEGDAKWHLKTRFLVRGHWREQPVGPGRQLKRPTYIAPYLKGPTDAPLNETTAINVWRR